MRMRNRRTCLNPTETWAFVGIGSRDDGPTDGNPTWTRRKVQLMVPKDLWITGIEDRNLVLNVPRTTCAVYRSDKIAKEGKETKHS